jgi:hypothetical protein
MLDASKTLEHKSQQIFMLVFVQIGWLKLIPRVLIGHSFGGKGNALLLADWHASSIILDFVINSIVLSPKIRLLEQWH